MEFTVSLALFDLIPVAVFLVAVILMQQTFYKYMNSVCYTLYSTGTVMVFVAGFFKALWKLFFALGFCDFQALNSCNMPLQSVGFLMAAVSVLSFTLGKKIKPVPKPVIMPADTSDTPMDSVSGGNGITEENVSGDLPASVIQQSQTSVQEGPAIDIPLGAAASVPVISGTVGFIIMMVLGVTGTNAGYVLLSMRRRRPLAAAMFIASFVFLVCMGFLGNQDNSTLAVNWVAEVINTAGQICLLIGVLDLRAGIKKQEE